MPLMTIRQGDRLPELEATLTGADGAAAPLTGATVRFHMRARRAADAKVDAAAIVVDAAAGTVRYQWAEADTDTAGLYRAEFEVTFSDGRQQTFPNPGYISIRITDELV